MSVTPQLMGISFDKTPHRARVRCTSFNGDLISDKLWITFWEKVFLQFDCFQFLEMNQFILNSAICL